MCEGHTQFIWFLSIYLLTHVLVYICTHVDRVPNPKYLLLYVYVCSACASTHIHICKWWSDPVYFCVSVYVREFTHTCGDQKTTLGIIPQVLSIINFFYYFIICFRQDFSLEPTNSTRRLSIYPVTCLSLLPVLGTRALKDRLIIWIMRLTLNISLSPQSKPWLTEPSPHPLVIYHAFPFKLPGFLT